MCLALRGLMSKKFFVGFLLGLTFATAGQISAETANGMSDVLEQGPTCTRDYTQKREDLALLFGVGAFLGRARFYGDLSTERNASMRGIELQFVPYVKNEHEEPSAFDKAVGGFFLFPTLAFTSISNLHHDGPGFGFTPQAALKISKAELDFNFCGMRLYPVQACLAVGITTSYAVFEGSVGEGIKNAHTYDTEPLALRLGHLIGPGVTGGFSLNYDMGAREIVNKEPYKFSMLSYGLFLGWQWANYLK